MGSEDTWAGKELRAVAKELGEDIRKVLDQAAKDTMEDFYKDYSPKYYERTGNLKQAYRSRVTVDTLGRNELKLGNTVINNAIPNGTLVTTASVTFSPKYMKPYVQNDRFIDTLDSDGYGSWLSTLNAEAQSLWGYREVPPEIVFELDFMQGYHGGKTWGVGFDWTDMTNRQPAKRMKPSPYELMEKRYKEISREGGSVDRYLTREYAKIHKRIDVAIMKDIAEEFNKIQEEVNNNG